MLADTGALDGPGKWEWTREVGMETLLVLIG